MTLEQALKLIREREGVSEINASTSYTGDGTGCLFQGVTAFSFVFDQVRIACFEENGIAIFKKEFDYSRLK